MWDRTSSGRIWSAMFVVVGIAILTAPCATEGNTITVQYDSSAYQEMTGTTYTGSTYSPSYQPYHQGYTRYDNYSAVIDTVTTPSSFTYDDTYYTFNGYSTSYGGYYQSFVYRTYANYTCHWNSYSQWFTYAGGGQYMTGQYLSTMSQSPNLTRTMPTASLTINPSGPISVGNNVITLTNAAGTRDTGSVTALSLTQGLNGTFGLAGIAQNDTIAGTVNGSVTFTENANLLKGAKASGAISMTLDGTHYPGSATVNGQAAPATVGYTLSYTKTSGGAAVADANNVVGQFGAALSANVVAGGSYADLESTVTGTVGSGGGSAVGTRARLLAGTKSTGSDGSVVMQWRTRTLDEAAGTNGLLINSDVLLLTGMNKAGGQTAADGRAQAAPFVLQMSYQPVAGTTNGTPYWIDFLNLGSDHALGGAPGPAHDFWADAVSANFANASGLNGDSRFVGSWDTFMSAGHPGFGHTLSQLVGAEGYDPTNDQTWAVLDYNNAQFAVVPTPVALWSGLATLGGLVVIGLARRRGGA
jgi:hypothetical protein